MTSYDDHSREAATAMSATTALAPPPTRSDNAPPVVLSVWLG